MGEETKTLDPAVAEILEKVKELSVLQLKGLVDALSEEFGVDASAPMMAAMPMMPGMGVPGAGAAEEEVVEKAIFDVVITAIGDKKIQVIKAVPKSPVWRLKMRRNWWRVRRRPSRRACGRWASPWATLATR